MNRRPTMGKTALSSLAFLQQTHFRQALRAHANLFLVFFAPSLQMGSPLPQTPEIYLRCELRRHDWITGN